jgi:hypothetical protein
VAAAIYVKIGAVAARIISHQGKEILRSREARQRKPLRTPPAYRQRSGASRISTGCAGVSNFAQTPTINEHILHTVEPPFKGGAAPKTPAQWRAL